MKLAVALVALGILAYVVFDFVKEYAAAAGTTWQRLLAAGKGSATVLWARFGMLVGALAGLLAEAADWLNAPGLADAIKSAMTPQYVAFFTIGLMLVSEFARRRTLNK